MHKVIVVRGIQGSGKSTWAREWAEQDPNHRIRFNQDDIRNMMGVYWVPTREDIIKDMKETFIVMSMAKHFDIVMDNMNLNPKEISWIEARVLEHNQFEDPENQYDIEFQDFKTPLEECIRRDSLREKPIGEKVIRATYEKYKDFYEQDSHEQ